MNKQLIKEVKKVLRYGTACEENKEIMLKAREAVKAAMGRLLADKQVNWEEYNVLSKLDDKLLNKITKGGWITEI